MHFHERPAALHFPNDLVVRSIKYPSLHGSSHWMVEVDGPGTRCEVNVESGLRRKTQMNISRPSLHGPLVFLASLSRDVPAARIGAKSAECRPSVVG